MKVTGTATLSADRGAVWRALTDPAVLQRSIPGCQSLEALGEDSYAMRVAAGVGSIKGVYDGQVRLTDQQEPGSFRLHAQGSGAPGTIGADVLVTLEDAPDGRTALTYDADATVGGMIGGVGQRMLVGVSKKMAGQFFANVDAAMTGVGAGAGAGAGAGLPGDHGRLPPTTGHAGMPIVYRDAVPGRAPGPRSGFAAGVAAGAAAALAGALVGAWIAGRRR